MIITRTPLRISFLGGGTDYPDHFRKYGGQTLGVAINKYSYLILKELAPLFDYTSCISYRKTELVKEVIDIQHPSVRECFNFHRISGHIEVHYVGDLPAKSGLGSSSSFTVGLLHALSVYRDEFPNLVNLAANAVHVEREMIKERVGLQDQYTCALGGMVHLQYNDDNTVIVNRVHLTPSRVDEFESHIMLFYTGIQRFAHNVLDEQIEKTKSGVITNDLIELGGLVDNGIEVLKGNKPILEFGRILHEAWMIKRGLSSKISNNSIDEAYKCAIRAGAIGGKLLGAGGGGFLLFFSHPDNHRAIEKALIGMPRIPVRFDTIGSKLIFNESESASKIN